MYFPILNGELFRTPESSKSQGRYFVHFLSYHKFGHVLFFCDTFSLDLEMSIKYLFGKFIPLFTAEGFIYRHFSGWVHLVNLYESYMVIHTALEIAATKKAT